jgi:hypothetical protein
MNIESFETIKVQVLGLPLRNPEEKWHLNVVPTERHKVYYREGSGASSQRLRIVWSLCLKLSFLSLSHHFHSTYINHLLFLVVEWRTPKLLNRLKCESEVKTTKKSKVGARSLAHNTLGDRGACWSSKMGLGRMTSTYSLTQTCTKPNNKLVNVLFKHFWCEDEPRANSDS